MKILKIMLEDVVNNIINLHIALYRSLKYEVFPALLCTTALVMMTGLTAFFFIRKYLYCVSRLVYFS